MSGAFVLDSSIALAWCFADEATDDTRALLERMVEVAAVVPGWWFLEVTNVLAVAERRARITPEQTSDFLAMLESFDLEVDNAVTSRAWGPLLTLCRAHQLSSYDAVYLELAIRRRLPLATLDNPLRAAAGKENVPVIGR